MGVPTLSSQFRSTLREEDLESRARSTAVTDDIEEMDPRSLPVDPLETFRERGMSCRGRKASSSPPPASLPPFSELLSFSLKIDSSCISPEIPLAWSCERDALSHSAALPTDSRRLYFPEDSLLWLLLPCSPPQLASSQQLWPESTAESDPECLPARASLVWWFIV